MNRSMLKRVIFLGVLLLALIIASIVVNAAEQASSQSVSGAFQPPFPSAEFPADPGITPDSPFYFLDQWSEKLFLGDNPQKAMEYRQEKIAEAMVMAQKKKAGEAKEALQQASEYGLVVEAEITPEMEPEVMKTSAALDTALAGISEGLPELKENVAQQMEQGKRMVLAGQVSAKIKALCGTLSKLDPKQYEKTCAVSEDSPQWQQDEHEKLTQEQRQHAETFIHNLGECSRSPEKCDCKGLGVKSFEESCVKSSEAMVACRKGDENACQSMLELSSVKLEETLPTYLREAMKQRFEHFQEGMEQNFQGDFTKTLPQPCKEAGATSMSGCAQVMKEKGFFKDEKSDDRDEGGEDSSVVSDQSGRPGRIREFGRDCHGVQDLSEKAHCFEQFYDQAQEKYERKEEWQFDRSMMPESAVGPDGQTMPSEAMRREFSDSSAEMMREKERMRERMGERGGGDEVRVQPQDVDHMNDGQREEYQRWKAEHPELREGMPGLPSETSSPVVAPVPTPSTPESGAPRPSPITAPTTPSTIPSSPSGTSPGAGSSTGTSTGTGSAYSSPSSGDAGSHWSGTSEGSGSSSSGSGSSSSGSSSSGSSSGSSSSGSSGAGSSYSGSGSGERGGYSGSYSGSGSGYSGGSYSGGEGYR